MNITTMNKIKLILYIVMVNNVECPKVQVKLFESAQTQNMNRDSTTDSFMKGRFMYSFCMTVCLDSLYSLYVFPFDNSGNMNLKKTCGLFR